MSHLLNIDARVSAHQALHGNADDEIIWKTVATSKGARIAMTCVGRGSSVGSSGVGDVGGIGGCWCWGRWYGVDLLVAMAVVVVVAVLTHLSGARGVRAVLEVHEITISASSQHALRNTHP